MRAVLVAAVMVGLVGCAEVAPTPLAGNRAALAAAAASKPNTCEPVVPGSRRPTDSECLCMRRDFAHKLTEDEASTLYWIETKTGPSPAALMTRLAAIEQSVRSKSLTAARACGF